MVKILILILLFALVLQIHSVKDKNKERVNTKKPKWNNFEYEKTQKGAATPECPHEFFNTKHLVNLIGEINDNRLKTECASRDGYRSSLETSQNPGRFSIFVTTFMNYNRVNRTSGVSCVFTVPAAKYECIRNANGNGYTVRYIRQVRASHSLDNGHYEIQYDI